MPGAERKEAPLAGYIAMIVVGLLFFLFGTFMLNSYGNKSKCTEQVTAKVVKMVEHRSSGTGRHKTNSTTYAPVFKYEYDGKEYSYISTVATNPPEFSAGERVTIWVNPNAPNKIYYKPGFTSVMLSVLFRIIGGALSIGGVVLLIKRKPKKMI